MHRTSNTSPERLYVSRLESQLSWLGPVRENIAAQQGAALAPTRATFHHVRAARQGGTWLTDHPRLYDSSIRYLLLNQVCRSHISNFSRIAIFAADEEARLCL